MANINFESLDFSLLTETEKDFFEKTFQKKPITWLLGMFFGVSVLFGIIVAVTKGDNFSFAFYTNAGIKSLLFISLALWARSWSLSAAILLFFWHLYSNIQFILSNNPFLNLQYIAGVFFFFIGIFVANKRRTLLKKINQIGPNHEIKADEI